MQITLFAILPSGELISIFPFRFAFKRNNSRFAVKEAAYKALYPTVRPTWKELSFMSYGELFPGSKPQLTYESLNTTEGELGKIDRLRLHVSVSHDGEYIAATVLAESSTS